MTKDEIIQNILDQRTAEQMIHLSDNQGFKQFVTTGLQMGAKGLTKYIGYCVQIRKNCGQYGSDMVFLRHPDGSLTTHENQCFYYLTEEQEVLARTIFEVLPEDEDFSLGFTCCDKIHEVGFIIEKSQSQPSPTSPFMITINKGDGSVESTVII